MFSIFTQKLLEPISNKPLLFQLYSISQFFIIFLENLFPEKLNNRLVEFVMSQIGSNFVFISRKTFSKCDLFVFEFDCIYTFLNDFWKLESQFTKFQRTFENLWVLWQNFRRLCEVCNTYWFIFFFGFSPMESALLKEL